MKRKWIILAGMLTMISTILGCTTASQDLVQEDYLRLERSLHDRKVRALWFSVREKNHGLVVSGVLKQYQRNARPIKAHVHVTVRTPDGRVIVERRSQDLYVPRNRIGGGSRYFKRFTVWLDIIPPPDSVIQIVGHSEDARWSAFIEWKETSVAKALRLPTRSVAVGLGNCLRSFDIACPRICQ